MADAATLARLLHISSAGLLEADYAARARPGEGWHAVATRDIARPGVDLSYDQAVIATLGGQVAGAIFLTECIFDSLPAEDMAQPAVAAYARLMQVASGSLVIRELATFPHARRKGIATALLGLAAEHARHRAMPALSLTVRRENTEARRLYDREGFVVAAEGAVPLAAGEVSMLVMLKRVGA